VRCIARNANYKSCEPIFRLREIKQEELCASKTNAAAGFCFNFRITKARTCIYIIWSGLNILKQCICASTPRQSDFPSFSRNVRGGGGGAHSLKTAPFCEPREARREGDSRDCYEQKPHGRNLERCPNCSWALCYKYVPIKFNVNTDFEAVRPPVIKCKV
jgi:hypothetical protein